MTSVRSRRRRPARLPLARGPDGARPLSQTAEYALRAMAQLAREYGVTAVRASDLASEVNVPVHYLSKVLRRLVEAGLLSSQKGHGGGFVLARPPHRIRFADVLAAVDQAPASGRCAFGWGKCNTRSPCPLHPAWSGLNQLLAGWAEGTTLADVG